MPSFSKRSRDNLETADVRLQKLFNEVIKEFDCTIISGHRSPEEQFELFKKGRQEIDGVWKKVGATVTNLDGTVKRSRHNDYPSRAVDVVPYPIDWNNIKAFEEMGRVVKRKAAELGISVEWGGEWPRFRDLPHFQVA